VKAAGSREWDMMASIGAGASVAAIRGLFVVARARVSARVGVLFVRALIPGRTGQVVL
jgi:hypothetical protein